MNPDTDAKSLDDSQTMASSLAVPEALPTPDLPAGVMQDFSLIQDQYPHIGEKIRQLSWGSVELQKYLTSIIFDERGDRRGFPQSISSALMRIYDVHNKLVPPTIVGDIWDHILNGIEN